MKTQYESSKIMLGMPIAAEKTDFKSINRVIGRTST